MEEFVGCLCLGNFECLFIHSHPSGFNTVICLHSVNFLPARLGLLSIILSHGVHDAQLQQKRTGREWKGRERKGKWKKEKERGRKNPTQQ